MYIPKPFEMNDPVEITHFLQSNSFGLLTSVSGGQPVATHLPFLYEPEQNVLFAHMAKANPQWQDISGQTVLTVFSGSHAYISPAWYEVPNAVPTWNYVAVHVTGKCSVIGIKDLGRLLDTTVRFYEPDSVLSSQTEEPFYQQMMKAIVGVRIDITRVEGVAKLSQNKSANIQQRVITQLRNSEDANAHGVAQLMEQQLKNHR